MGDSIALGGLNSSQPKRRLSPPFFDIKHITCIAYYIVYEPVTQQIKKSHKMLGNCHCLVYN